jgi:hypothetical protein
MSKMRSSSIILLTGWVLNNAFAQQYCSVSSLPSALQTSLVAYYPFCGNANDVTSNAYNGTVYNATPGNDRYGNPNSAYSFNGASSRIEITTPFMNNSWAGYCISMWFFTDDLNQTEQNFFNTLPHNSISIGYNYLGNMLKHVCYGLNSNPANNTFDVITEATDTYTNYAANQWYHIALVKNGNQWKFFRNGTMIQTFTTSAAITNTLTGIIIGAQDPPTQPLKDWFSGKLDDYMIYNRALSDAEIQMLYCMPPPAPAAIVGSTVICQGVASNYSIATVPGATSYSWALPAGWTGGGSGNAINPTAGSSGTLSVVATNSCGAGAPQTLSVTVNICTGVKETAIHPETVFFPNPFSEKVSVKVNGPAALRIIGVTGECLLSVQLTEGENSVAVSSLPPGLYFCYLKQGNAPKMTKIIKR